MEELRGSSVDSFGTFLENISSEQSRQQAPVGSSFDLLTTLETSGPQSVPGLMTISGMGFTDFTGALTTMKETGLITLVGPPGQEQVALTASGEQVARLSRGR